MQEELMLGTWLVKLIIISLVGSHPSFAVAGTVNKVAPRSQLREAAPSPLALPPVSSSVAPASQNEKEDFEDLESLYEVETLSPRALESKQNNWEDTEFAEDRVSIQRRRELAPSRPKPTVVRTPKALPADEFKMQIKTNEKAQVKNNTQGTRAKTKQKGVKKK